MIKHNSYFDGKVQSLGFQAAGGNATVGVMEPGVHDFGQASIPEEITVVAGRVEAKGASYGKGGVFGFEPGDRIVFDVKETLAYLCQY